MKNRNLFILIIIVFILAPAIHFFIAGKDVEQSTLRIVLVGLQILGGIFLVIYYGLKPKEKK